MNKITTFAILILLTGFFLNTSSVFGKNFHAHADEGTSTNVIQKTLTYKGSSHASGLFSGNGLSLTLPGNIQPGDLLIAVAGNNGNVASWTTSAGWIQGKNSGVSDAQGLTWWWKVADGSEAGTQIRLQSSSYADGGAVVNVYSGQAVDPIAGVSSMTTTDNFGTGHVNSATVAGVPVGTSITAVPLIFASWQPNATTITLPNGFALESAADDGYSFIATGEAYSSLTTDNFPGYSLSFSSGQAVVQTLQVLVNVK